VAAFVGSIDFKVSTLKSMLPTKAATGSVQRGCFTGKKHSWHLWWRGRYRGKHNFHGG